MRTTLRKSVLASLLSLLSLLSSVSSGGTEPPALLADANEICAGQTVTFATTTAISPAGRVAWSFPGGTPGAASGPGPIAVRYLTPGIFDASLTLDGSTTTQRGFVLVAQCSPLAGEQVHWYFGKHAGLSFASGVPVADLQGQTDSKEPSVTESDAAGALLFYSNGRQVYDRHHTLINPATPLIGHDSVSQGALAVPDPGAAGRYYLFTLGPADGSAADLWYTLVDTGTSPPTLSQVNTPVPLPGGAHLAEQLTAVPRCDGEGFWVIVHGGGVPQRTSSSSP